MPGPSSSLLTSLFFWKWDDLGKQNRLPGAWISAGFGCVDLPHLPRGAQLVGSTLGILLLEQKKGKQNRTSRCNTTAFGCSVSDRSQAQQDGAVPYLKCSRGFPQVQILE